MNFPERVQWTHHFSITFCVGPKAQHNIRSSQPLSSPNEERTKAMSECNSQMHSSSSKAEMGPELVDRETGLIHRFLVQGLHRGAPFHPELQLLVDREIGLIYRFLVQGLHRGAPFHQGLQLLVDKEIDSTLRLLPLRFPRRTPFDPELQ